jgi:hypothetical protein
MDLETISRQDCILSKEIAYLLGVYLTDGLITECNFQLQVVDEDFINTVYAYLKKFFPNSNATIRERKDISGWNKKKRYVLKIGIGKYAEWFKNQTNNKHHLPISIWHQNDGVKRWFIAGVMDGDGWISVKKRKHCSDKFQYCIGIGGVEDGWIHEFRELLCSFDVKCNKIERVLTRNGRWFCRFSIRPKTFFDAKLFFTIKRKSDRCTVASETAR